MVFHVTKLSDAFLIEAQPHFDDRGFFARVWCAEEFSRYGLNPTLTQCNISFNRSRGTLRGMHFQAEPHGEAKVVRCTKGTIYDVIVDLRPKSATYCRWESFELSADNHQSLFVPRGFAHGFQTLEEGCEVFYQMSDVYHAEAARGVRWDDQAFGIVWPIADPIMSERDRAYSDYLR